MVEIIVAVLVLAPTLSLFMAWWMHRVSSRVQKDMSDAVEEGLREELERLREQNRLLRGDQKDLIRQIQDMAERIAALKMGGAEMDENDRRFVPDVPPGEPLSQQIADFLDAIESEELRQVLHEQAIEMREHMPDEAVYRHLTEGIE